MNTASRPLRIALLGCGQIADAHLQEIAKLPGAHVAAVCDVYPDLARQAAERFDVPRADSDLQQMLDEVRPDVVHVTTPAHTHAALGRQLLQAGCHVYMEKPLALTTGECDELIAAAVRHERLLCVGHDQLYDPLWLECRRRIDAGEIGKVRHVESVLGYPLSGQFGAVVSSDPGHWVRRLPGGLFHNTISHPLYRITDLLPDDEPLIDALWFGGGGGSEFPTEMLLHLRGAEVTGSLLFDTRIEPQRITRVYGSRGCLEADFDTQVLRTLRKARLPGALAKLEGPWRQWREAARNLRRNVSRFVRSDIHYFAGMGRLFGEFYEAIRTGGVPPIPYAEMRRVSHIMDEAFEQCRAREEPSAKRRVPVRSDETHSAIEFSERGAGD